jgi:hypothetical protein
VILCSVLVLSVLIMILCSVLMLSVLIVILCSVLVLSVLNVNFLLHINVVCPNCDFVFRNGTKNHN